MTEKEDKEYNAPLLPSSTLQAMHLIVWTQLDPACPEGWEQSLGHYRPDQKRARDKSANKQAQVSHNMQADFWTRLSGIADLAQRAAFLAKSDLCFQMP